MKKYNCKNYSNISIYTDQENPDIVFWKYQENLTIDLPIAKELVENRLEYSNNETVYALIDVSNIQSSTREARDYLSQPEGGLRKLHAGAFVSNNILSNVLINLFFKINKPSIPAKFFKNEDDAYKWLKTIKTKSEETE